MTRTTPLSPDTEAILLLCGRFGQEAKDSVAPLTPAKYNRLAKWLGQQGLRPEALLEPSVTFEGIEETGLEPEHITALLARGFAMAMALDHWLRHGLWVISRADQHYPARYKTALKNQAPPILYGTGDPGLLSDGGLAIVGSRDVDDAGIAFTRAIAKQASGGNLAVISGAAKGVDQAAMVAALDAGGAAIGIVSDGLTKHAVYGPYRDAIRDERLTLISPFAPETSFNAGNLMGRNKLIYTLADWAFVVASAHETGGTWTGAAENLSKSWTPLFVRVGADVPEGNHRLLDLGAIPIDDSSIGRGTSLVDEFERLIPQASNQPSPTEPDFATLALDQEPPDDEIFAAVWPIIARHLDGPRTEKDLHAALGPGIQVGQLRLWLRRAIDEGLAEKPKRTSVYILTAGPQPDDRQQRLFDISSL